MFLFIKNYMEPDFYEGESAKILADAYAHGRKVQKTVHFDIITIIIVVILFNSL